MRRGGGTDDLVIFRLWVDFFVTKEILSCEVMLQWAGNQRKVASDFATMRRMRCANVFVLKWSWILWRDVSESVMSVGLFLKWRREDFKHQKTASTSVVDIGKKFFAISVSGLVCVANNMLGVLLDYVC